MQNLVGSVGREFSRVGVLILSLFSFCASVAYAQPVDRVPEIEPAERLSNERLTRLQREENSWKLDAGAALQVQDLMHGLYNKNAIMMDRYRDDPAGFDKVLSKKNISVSSEFGSATRIQLKLKDNKKADLVLVSLKNVRGEPVEVIVADLAKIPPETPDLQVFIADKLTYEPANGGSAFGKSVLLVDSEWKNPGPLAQNVVNPDKQLFFPKGSNLKAWATATLFRPKIGNVVMNLPSTGIQVLFAAGIGYLSNDVLHISTTEFYIPAVLSAMWSMVISANLETYTALVKKGHALKRFAFNFFGTSISYAVALNLWDIGPRFLTDASRLTFMVINGLAGNAVKTSLYNFAHMRQDTGIVDGNYTFKVPFTNVEFSSSKAEVQRELGYSTIANPLRLLDLTANATSADGHANTEVKMAVKGAYLLFAMLSHWCITRYAERVAAKARNDEEYAKKVDLRALSEGAARLRKGIEEAKNRVLGAPGRLMDHIMGRHINGLDVKEVSKLFQHWMTAQASYLYRYENSSRGVSDSELAKYRRTMVDELVDLSMASIAARNLDSVRVASAAELQEFLSLNAKKQMGRIDYLAVKTASESPQGFAPRIEEYSLVLRDLMDATAQKFKAEPKKYSVEVQRKILGFMSELVESFPENAKEYTREFLVVKLAEAFGAYGGKAVEHFSSRQILWRYLYTNEVPEHLKQPFVDFVNHAEEHEFDVWRTKMESRYDYLNGSMGSSGASYVNVYRQELNEINSLTRELYRRIEIKKKRLKRIAGVTDVSFFKEEILAFKALMDYRAEFDQRWPLVPQSFIPPEAMWSYSKKKGSLKISGRAAGGSPCFKALLAHQG